MFCCVAIILVWWLATESPKCSRCVLRDSTADWSRGATISVHWCWLIQVLWVWASGTWCWHQHPRSLQGLMLLTYSVTVRYLGTGGRKGS